jgi:hypothetical protein
VEAVAFDDTVEELRQVVEEGLDADRLCFLFRFSFGDFLTSSGRAAVTSDGSILIISTSSSVVPTSTCGVSASQT